jgi:hypothetical protein
VPTPLATAPVFSAATLIVATARGRSPIASREKRILALVVLSKKCCRRNETVQGVMQIQRRYQTFANLTPRKEVRGEARNARRGAAKKKQSVATDQRGVTAAATGAVPSFFRFCSEAEFAFGRDDFYAPQGNAIKQRLASISSCYLDGTSRRWMGCRSRGVIAVTSLVRSDALASFSWWQNMKVTFVLINRVAGPGARLIHLVGRRRSWISSSDAHRWCVCSAIMARSTTMALSISSLSQQHALITGAGGAIGSGTKRTSSAWWLHRYFTAHGVCNYTVNNLTLTNSSSPSSLSHCHCSFATGSFRNLGREKY